MNLTVILAGLTSAPLQRFKALETLLSRGAARHVAAGGMNAALTQVFHLSTAQIAVAPLTRLADSGCRDDAYWLRADPVHLVADRDQLVMLRQSALEVTVEEAKALAETFNRMYAADGLLLETPVPSRWYLRIPATLDCITHDPTEVEGNAVLDCMPTGTDEAKLRQLMNEIQMLFHEHPVNLAREAVGKPAINSVWLWGGGRLPEIAENGPRQVITDVPLVRGLALLAGSRCVSWPAASDAVLWTDESLIALNVNDEADYSAMDRDVARPLLAALRSGRLKTADIYTGGTAFCRVSRAMLFRFWRRRRPLAELLETS
jgi:hypothetical protein